MMAKHPSDRLSEDRTAEQFLAVGGDAGGGQPKSGAPEGAVTIQTTAPQTWCWPAAAIPTIDAARLAAEREVPPLISGGVDILRTISTRRCARYPLPYVAGGGASGSIFWPILLMTTGKFRARGWWSTSRPTRTERPFTRPRWRTISHVAGSPDPTMQRRTMATARVW